ncbi:MAG: prephenate dehydrogenase, partial [bacterium]
MNFQKIAIIGLGLIGGSLAAALKRKNVATHLIGIDYEDVVAQALSRGLIAEGYDLTNIETGLSSANLIILATPSNRILDLLCEISDKVKDGTLITDVGSTKVKIIETAKTRLPEGVYFLGGHPMTGTEKSGLDHADPFLFENAVYVLAENNDLPGELVAGFVDLIETI